MGVLVARLGKAEAFSVMYRTAIPAVVNLWTKWALGQPDESELFAGPRLMGMPAEMWDDTTPLGPTYRVERPDGWEAPRLGGGREHWEACWGNPGTLFVCWPGNGPSVDDVDPNVWEPVEPLV